MPNPRPKPYRRMIVYVLAALVVAFGLATWYSHSVHPGDASGTPSTNTAAPG